MTSLPAPQVPEQLVGGVDMWDHNHDQHLQHVNKASREQLTDARRKAAGVLLKMFLRPEDLGRFAVAFMPLGTLRVRVRVTWFPLLLRRIVCHMRCSHAALCGALVLLGAVLSCCSVRCS
jgi:hypothetical protein